MEFDREVSVIRRQCEAERLTKDDLQKQYDLLKSQYHDELDALDTDDRRQRPKKEFERLQELENAFVGGEAANNEERKKKLNDMRSKQKQRKRVANAIRADDDDAMMRVFDNIQDQVGQYAYLSRLDLLFFSCISPSVNSSTNGWRTNVCKPTATICRSNSNATGKSI